MWSLICKYVNLSCLHRISHMMWPWVLVHQLVTDSLIYLCVTDAKILLLSDSCVRKTFWLLENVTANDCLTSIIINPHLSSLLFIFRGNYSHSPPSPSVFIFLFSVTSFLFSSHYAFSFFIPQLTLLILHASTLLYPYPSFVPMCCSPSHAPQQQWQALLYSWYEVAYYPTACVCVCLRMCVCVSVWLVADKTSQTYAPRQTCVAVMVHRPHRHSHTYIQKHTSVHVNT